jgi:MoaA/NifB/PqqE/SkfB family radical SAM enzyme
MAQRVDIKIGFLCNNRCKFCVQGNKRDIFGNKAKEKIKRELEKARNSCSEVVFTGGEPTLHKDFFELVRHANKLKYKRIQIQTNGRLFAYKNFCLKAIRAGANEFSPALHGHNSKIHDFLTSSSGSFTQTVKGIENLKKLGQYVLTNTVITTTNYKYLPQIARLLVDLGVDQYQFAFPHILGRAKENKSWLIPKKSEIIDYVKKGLDIGINTNKRVMTEAIPCCFMNNGYEKYVAERIIPDTKVFDADLVISSYNEYRKTIGKIKGPKCNLCNYNETCEGPWKEYPQYFGWEEFKPVVVSRALGLKICRAL